MSQSVRDFNISLTSTNDLSAGTEFLVMKVDTANDHSVVTATASTDPIVGILQNKPKAGAAADLRFVGTSKVQAGGTITRGDRVTATTGGKVITTTSNKDVCVGIALASAVSGDVVEIMLTVGTPMSQ